MTDDYGSDDCVDIICECDGDGVMIMVVMIVLTLFVSD